MRRKIITQQGTLLSLLGMLVVFAAILWGTGANAELGKTFFLWLQTIGITLFAFGLFSIIVESKNWRNYFESRLKEIVVDHSYLNSLGVEKLKVLQIDVMKAFFKNPHIDKEKSFLKFFNDNLHCYISEPYREDVSTEVIFLGEEGNCYKFFDRVSYVCRKTGDTIQKEVKWRADPGEFEKVYGVEISIKYPSHHCENGKSISIHKADDLENVDPVKIEISESLEDYKDIDGLSVIVTSKYAVNKDRFQYWQMAHPTKNLDITIKYPEEMKMQYKQLVLNPEMCQITEQDGYLKIKYDSWMLPLSGLAWRFYKTTP